MIDAFFTSLGMYGDPKVWLFIGIGILDGLVIGIIPGIGTMLALTLFLPFMFALSPEYALPMVVASLATNPIGGIVSTILLGIPGNISNVATVADGFAMTRKGQGARAMGAALASSGMAAIVGVLICLAIIPLILPMIYALDSGDMLFLIVMALAFITVLSKGSPINGVISGAMGMIFSLVGAHAISGEFRFTFGTNYLVGGFPIVSVALGMFAIPALFEIATAKAESISAVGKTALGLVAVFQGVKDLFRHWALWLRCLIMGWVIGILPGVGGGTVIWVGYGHARQSSKYPEKFGKGVVEGVIAPECCANAENSGALLTTLALGIPGSATTVLVLAAMIMLNISPGPNMLTTQLPLTITTMEIGAVSAFIGAIICILMAGYLARLAKVPTRIMMPIIVLLVFIGAYAVNAVFLDLVACLGFGALGLVMIKYGFNRPAFLLGFVCGGDLFEKYLYIALSAHGPLFFLKPTSLVLIAVTVALFTYGPIGRMIRGLRAKKRASTS